MRDFVKGLTPFGGPRPGEILVEFGIGPARLYNLLRRILDSRFIEPETLAPAELVCIRAMVDAQPIMR
jgi:hypothetical protein